MGGVMWAVETEGLGKAYGPVASLVDCDLHVPPGEVFGLLGPNGAGKTTLLRTLLGFLTPTAGRAWVGGYEVGRQSVDVRRYCSYLPGDARLYRGLRGRGLLEMFSGLHPHGSLANSLDVAQRFDLDLSRRVLFMSTGMRQK
ncbi:MAG: ATP-binding cassette domain-containing protein, partial [Planctomycetales bacterium]|nr:ATP-binding cassette domain-containing protein [Planctomycetales bacterium]